MLGRLIFFLGGVYGGIYVDQHYQIPKVDDPKAMWEKIKSFAEGYKKDDTKSDD